jgi:hypothetical protein
MQFDALEPFIDEVADAAIRWCDLALVKSGTITLQIARELRPMVTFYKSSPLGYYLIGKWVLSTKFFTLPNLLAHREIVPEFVPHFGGANEIVQAARSLIDAPARAQEQREELARVIELFRDRNAASAAADARGGLLRRHAAEGRRTTIGPGSAPASGQERYIAETFCTRATDRVHRTLDRIESNDDDRLHAIARIAYEKGGYGYNLFGV